MSDVGSVGSFVIGSSPIGTKIVSNGNTIVTTSDGISITDVNNNVILMDPAGIHINGQLFARSAKIG